MDAFHSLTPGRRPLAAAACALIALLADPGSAAARERPAARPDPAVTPEPAAELAERLRPHGWTVHIDNDLFAFGNQDRDYTAGLSVTLGGEDAAGPKPLSAALDWLDDKTGFGADASSGDRARSF